MIFQYTWQKVLAGRKTQTRRLAGDSDRLWTVDIDAGLSEKALKRGNRTKWQTGRSYSVQPGRGQKAIGRIRLLDIRYQHLGNVTEEEARAEGYANLEGFVQAWTEIHGHYDPERAVWALEFRLLGEGE
jgi:uncharacterized protein YhfF